jgi:hypothetical protein
MVGIFWMLTDISDIFYMTSQLIEEGEKYGDWIIATDEHFKKWEELRNDGYLQQLPAFLQEEYFALPRGRISYNKKNNMYYVYHGNWLRKIHKKLICGKYNIKITNAVFEFDVHYTI